MGLPVGLAALIAYYVGLIGFWDLRRGSHPVEKTVIEKTHADPVYDVEWIQSRIMAR